MDELRRFHLAIPVRDLASTRAFYGGVLGCIEARAHDDAVTFDFFGHQLVCHVAAAEAARNAVHHAMGDDDVPPRHFGAILGWEEWPRWVARVREAGVPFLIEPSRHDHGAGGLQATFFVRDPSGNVLELKALHDPARLFAR